MHRLVEVIFGDSLVFHHLEALLFQPLHLTDSGIFEILFRSAHKRKCHKMNVAFCRNLIVQLAHRTAAEISRILVFRIDILDLLVDLLKIGIADDRLAAQNQLSLVRDF